MTRPANPSDRPSEFDSWWSASKYCQVVALTSAERQIALDAWNAALTEPRAGDGGGWRDVGYGVIEDAQGREVGVTPGWSAVNRQRMLDAVNRLTQRTDPAKGVGDLSKIADAHEYFANNPDLRMTTGDHASYAARIRALATPRDEGVAVRPAATILHGDTVGPASPIRIGESLVSASPEASPKRSADPTVSAFSRRSSYVPPRKPGAKP